jgi:hypothetical protein
MDAILAIVTPAIMKILAPGQIDPHIGIIQKAPKPI